MIELKSEDLKRLNITLEQFPKELRKVSVRAINNAAKFAQNEAITEGVKKYYLKKKDIKDSFYLGKANYNNPYAFSNSRGKPLPLIKYKVNTKRPGVKRIVKASVKRGKRVKSLGNKTFIAKMNSGHIGVFQRSSNDSYPIKQLHAPSVPFLYKNETIAESIERKGKALLSEKLDIEISKVISKIF